MARAKDPKRNARGGPRQRWPATPTPDDGLRETKLAFRLSQTLRARILALADADQMPVSSWLEALVRREVEQRRAPPFRRQQGARHGG